MDIPIGINQSDQKVTTPLDQALINVTVTENGVLPRPGHVVLYDVGTSAKIDGLYDWREQSLIIAVSNGNVYKLTDSVDASDSFLLLESGDKLLLEDGFKLLLDTPAAAVDVTGATDFVVGTRVSFANWGSLLIMANGAQMQMLSATQSAVKNGGNRYICKLNHVSSTASEAGTGVDTATYWTQDGAAGAEASWVTGTSYYSGKSDVISDASAPTAVTHVCCVDAYIMALQSSTQIVWFSVVDEPWNWDSDFFSAEHLPDNANCLLESGGDVWVGGTRSIQSFINDGSTPWSPSGYGPIPHGVLAPYSFCWCPEVSTFIWVDDNRRLVKLEGRSATTLNHSLDTFIKKVPSVTDAIGDYCVIDGTPYYLLQFPTSAVSVAVNLLNGTWAEYTADGLTRWQISCITAVPAWDMVVAGHLTNGKLLTVKSSYALDVAADIPAKIRSPRIQTDTIKVVPSLVLHFTKLVDEASAGSASLSVRWRDDGQDWQTARTITLSDNDQTDYVTTIYRLGAYHSYRQYEFDCSDLHPFALARVTQK